MVSIKTADLIGPALDWAVGIAEGNPMERPESDVVWSKYHDAYNPSTNWSQGGPLIEANSLEVTKELGAWAAIRERYCGEAISWWPEGETILIAACRAIVAAKLGDQVQVPAEPVQEVAS